MHLKTWAILLLVIIISSSEVHSQQKKVDENIENVIFRARRNKMILPDNFVFEAENIQYTLAKIIPFTQDSNFIVRNQSYVIIHRAGQASKNESEINQCVETISNGCLDKNSGIARYCSKSLAKYKRESFSEKTKENISNAFIPKSRTLRNIAQLMGYLNLATNKEKLLLVTADDTEKKVNKWYAHLALARMGEEQSVQYCLNLYKNQKINIEVIENMIPDLLYTRQKAIYGEVIKILYSDEKNCISANPDNERKIPCGYWVMEQLGPYIEDFPLDTHASGAIKSDDYEKSLLKLRKWFMKRKDGYKIIDDSF